LFLRCAFRSSGGGRERGSSGGGRERGSSGGGRERGSSGGGREATRLKQGRLLELRF
jgi:hypothetical protein